MDQPQPNTQPVTTQNIVATIKFWFQYILSKWVTLAVIGAVGLLLGIIYARSQKAMYNAELTFTPESGSGGQLGAYMGLAAQFGIDLGSGGNVFEGDNIMELFKSKTLIENTLLTRVNINGTNQLLIDYYISTHYKEKDIKKIRDTKVDFSQPSQKGTRIRDSIMQKIVGIVGGAMNIDRKDKKLNIIAVRTTDQDEVFAKIFVEELTNNAVSYYVTYKSEKSRENVNILQKQADSVKRMLTGSISDVASINDLNVNPLKQAARVSSQRRTIDVQVDGAIYTEILKNLELAKITLRKETPFIQVIDRPSLPLEKKKTGMLKGGLIGGFLFGFLGLFFVIIRKIFLLH